MTPARIPLIGRLTRVRRSSDYHHGSVASTHDAGDGRLRSSHVRTPDPRKGGITWSPSSLNRTGRRAASKRSSQACIKQSAQASGILVLQPEDVNAPESLDVIRGLQPDLLVTAAYGQILSPALLAIPRLGGINLHGSILPAYRGAAPVARAIQNGETETGVTVIRMTPRIDAGGIAATAATPIEPDETAGELEERLATIGAPLVASVVDALAVGPIAVAAAGPEQGHARPRSSARKMA